jgi:hypothetical protein
MVSFRAASCMLVPGERGEQNLLSCGV